SADLIVYIGAVLAIPVFTLLVSDFSLLNEGKPLTLIPAATLEQLQNSENSFVSGVLATFVAAISKPSGLVLAATGLVALSYLVLQMSLISKIARDRLRVVLVLTFFSMVFWAIFEQAGSSVNIFTDRNVNRVYGGQVVSDEMVGQVIDLQPTQLQLGYSNGEDIMTLDKLEAFRQEHSGEGGTDAVMPWTVAEDNVGMRYADRKSELATSSFQAVNPVCILLFGLAFSAMWNFLGERGLDPNPAIKFALGLAQLGLGFGAFWYGTTQADGRGMVAVGWLILGYLLQTTGELCLSPVGLSMVSRLSPRHLVATVMGSWFLATAFSQYLAGIIAMFTSSTPHGHVESGAVPPPIETVTVYGQVFGILALLGIGSGVVCLLLSPLLKSWMHEGVVDDGS
ncbi:MAG: hypothetical protein KDA99_24720, partial [Planctomycetales bacterium]|nr:hypothetical protein [Planctomycetales bacterium]